jgi:DNA primase
MALPKSFMEELRLRTPMPDLVAERVALVKAGPNMKGRCPFHGEKTASMYVYPDHLHCYGCGAHEEPISFVMKLDKIGFMAAVEKLAHRVGMTLPVAVPKAADIKRTSLFKVLDAAVHVYQAWLYEPGGSQALVYLKDRGLTDETIQKFKLGWSGEGRGALAAALKKQGIETSQMIEAGLMRASEHGPVDMFFSRVMFPIRDRKGNTRSFGGRLLNDGQPKYVNGPETAVFSKRQSLYGIDFAKDEIHRGQPILITEGYLDVISLNQAGFGGAVAPLGTALTEDQMAEIWYLTGEPVLCFDGDAAGRRATKHAVEVVLSALKSGRSLRVLKLPEKDDPDSLLQRDGAIGFEQRLVAAGRLSAILYDLIAEDCDQTTPEGRSHFRGKLVSAAESIPDAGLAAEYKTLLLNQFFAAKRATHPILTRMSILTLHSFYT